MQEGWGKYYKGNDEEMSTPSIYKLTIFFYFVSGSARDGLISSQIVFRLSNICQSNVTRFIIA
jgi:hypothetical protein